MESLIFRTRTPKLFNLGDYLCGPRHYFEFIPLKSRKVVIIGGGAFNDLGLTLPDLDAFDQVVCWGVGRSVVPENEDFPTGEKLSGFDARRFVVGTRDIELVSGKISFVPCVSVFNPIVEIPCGSETGLFVNANSNASGNNVEEILIENSDLTTGTNAMSETDFVDRFAMTEKVITNSYHVAYWALLSGRAVNLIGYSSKFTSLTHLFDLPIAVATYRKGDSVELRGAVKAARARSEFVSLREPSAFRQLFRKLNVEFANRLVDLGVLRSVTPKQMSTDEARDRATEIAMLLQGERG